MPENIFVLGTLHSIDDLCAGSRIHRTCGADSQTLGRDYPVDTFWPAYCGFYWNSNCCLGAQKEKRTDRSDQRGAWTYFKAS